MTNTEVIKDEAASEELVKALTRLVNGGEALVLLKIYTTILERYAEKLEAVEALGH